MDMELSVCCGSEEWSHYKLFTNSWECDDNYQEEKRLSRPETYGMLANMQNFCLTMSLIKPDRRSCDGEGHVYIDSTDNIDDISE